MQNNDLIRKLLTMHIDYALQSKAWERENEEGDDEDWMEELVYNFFGKYPELMYILTILNNDQCAIKRIEKLVADRSESGYLSTWAPGDIMATVCPALSKKACTCTEE